MYPIGTILERNEPQDTPLDKLKIVAISPIKQASVAEWSGIDGEHVVVQPAEEFGANETAPTAVLQEQYTIVSMPDDEPQQEIVLDRRRGSLAHAETPEQAFARTAREAQTKSRK